ncbi:DUF6728 family protein [Tunicatimonas pelagia]|uniref:DUF6728 family protein n=1 Tax=Tunicatimonas pelagia TaxID=931531 RepID=UPI002666DCFB|nr:DUF6728 family protein [Tunicatimonas pelagia]WKN43990.1 hypothetical protein P0M28_03260 [Tunicatimonas pelagia]
MSNQPDKKDENSLKDYFAFGEVFGYFFRKKDPNRKTNFNLRMMHGINKISIIMFLLGIIFLIIKNVF